MSGPDQLPVNVGGPIGALARRLVYAVRMPTSEQRRVAVTGLFNTALKEATTAAASARAAAAGPAAATGGAGLSAPAAAVVPMERWLKKSSV